MFEGVIAGSVNDYAQLLSTGTTNLVSFNAAQVSRGFCLVFGEAHMQWLIQHKEHCPFMFGSFHYTSAQACFARSS